MKKCSKCKIEKELSFFTPNKKNKDGFLYTCKECTLNREREYRKNNKLKIDNNLKIYRDKNKNKISETKRLYRENNKVKISNYNKEYAQKNKIRIAEGKKRNAIINKVKINKRNNNWAKNRRANDSLFKLSGTLRGRLVRAFESKFWKKNGSTEKLLGESFEFVHKYIEIQFTKGMSWSNHGEWHIDHKIPLAYAKTEKELVALCHYTNLQPLWAIDNLTKNDKIIPHQIKLI